jgi:hypothetical protein
VDERERSGDSYACGNLTQCKAETTDTDLCQVFCQLGQALKVTGIVEREKK